MSTSITTLSGPTMGTRYSAQFCSTQNLDVPALHGALQAAVDQVDQQMSPWIETSIINQFNRAEIGEWITLPQETQDVLTMAIEIEEQSGGAFSITLADRVQHWGFGPDSAVKSTKLFDVLPAWDCFEIEPNRIRKLQPNQLDLCGIAKGYGVDQLAAIMRDHEIANYLVSIDGELRCAGSPADSKGWHVGLEEPKIGVRQIAHSLECNDLSLATSGGYRHFKSTDQGAVTHTICPQSGAPKTDIEMSVTVAHQSCCLADGWATAFMVMGSDTAQEFAEKYGMHMLILSRANGHMETSGTGSFTHVGLR